MTARMITAFTRMETNTSPIHCAVDWVGFVFASDWIWESLIKLLSFSRSYALTHYINSTDLFIDKNEKKE